MKKILSIVRTSTIEQETESQKKDVINFCISLGFKVNEIEVLEFSGASARKQNEKYLLMLQTIKKTLEEKNIKNVALWHLNRLGRTEENLSSMKEYFERNKIQVYIKNPSLTLFNSDGSLNIGVSMSWTLFAMMIKFETEELMNKLERGRKYKKSLNLYCGGQIPYGYKVNDKNMFEIDEEGSKIVKLIFTKYASGQYSTLQLAKELNELGYKTINGKKFDCYIISQILRNKIYINSNYPKFLDVELFNQCRLIAINNRSSISKERHLSISSRILRCPYCGYYYNMNMSNSKQYYTHNRYHDCESISKNVKKDFIDISMKDFAFHVYLKTTLYNREEEISRLEKLSVDDNNKLSLILLEIQSIKKKIDKINDMYLDGFYTEESHRLKFEKLDSDLRNYEIRKKELENSISSSKSQLKLLKRRKDNDAFSSVFQCLEDYNKLDALTLKEHIKNSVRYAYLDSVQFQGKMFKSVSYKSVDNQKSLYLGNGKNIFKFISISDKIVEKYLYDRDNEKFIKVTLDFSVEDFNRFYIDR